MRQQFRSNSKRLRRCSAGRASNALKHGCQELYFLLTEPKKKEKKMRKNKEHARRRERCTKMVEENAVSASGFGKVVE